MPQACRSRLNGNQKDLIPKFDCSNEIANSYKLTLSEKIKFMKIEIERKTLSKHRKVFVEARAQGTNEADTSTKIQEFLSEVFAYDRTKDMRKETFSKDTKSDIILRAGSKINIVVEIKAAHVGLIDKHVNQVVAYAHKLPTEWAVLTNGIEWHLYYIDHKKLGIPRDLFKIDLANEGETSEHLRCLRVLHNSMVQKQSLKEFQQIKDKMSAKNIGRILFSEEIMKSFKKKVNAKFPKLKLSRLDCAIELHKLLSDDAREQIEFGDELFKKVLKKTRNPSDAPSALEQAELSEEGEEDNDLSESDGQSKPSYPGDNQ